MKKTCILVLSILAALLLGCTAQKVQPTVPVYNITVTQTDNSQHIVGDKNKAVADNQIQAKPTADNKIQANAGAEATTKNSMWIFWLIITVFAIVCGWFAWRRWGTV